MEIKLCFEFDKIFPIDRGDVLKFFDSSCKNLSKNSFLSNIEFSDNGEKVEVTNSLILEMSKATYELIIEFTYPRPLITESGDESTGFRVIATNNTPDSHFFKASIIFESMGMDDLARDLRLEFFTVIVNDMLKDLLDKEIERGVVSQVNSKKASVPRNKYFNEVNEVIKLTWKKHPGASQTGLLEALCSHYYGKVSRNSLLKWITDSGLRPKKPKKFTSFELVFPQ